MQRPIDAALDELAEEFDTFDDDWEQRYSYVIELGKGLPELPSELHTDQNRVFGCVSRLWLSTEPQSDGTINFRAESDGHISRGIAAILLRLYSGNLPEDIIRFDIKTAMDRLRLPEAISVQRSNGLAAMVKRIRHDAAVVANKGDTLTY